MANVISLTKMYHLYQHLVAQMKHLIVLNTEKILNKNNKSMKANELRIGNYVFDECEPHYFKVEEITKYVGYELWVYYRNGSIKTKEPEPIPLTEQWLLDFGFVDEDLKMSGHKWFVFKRPHLHKMDIRIAIPKYDNEWSVTLECVSPPTMIISNIQFVHEWQNLYFALTGKELEKIAN